MENKNIENKNDETAMGTDNNLSQETATNNPSGQELPVNPVSINETKNEAQIKYAGFWIRFLAVFIDSVIVSIVSVPLMFLMGFGDKSFGVNFLGYVISWAYYIYMTDRYQATLGKRALGLKVVREDFSKASLENIILRETVGKIVSSLTLLVGYIMAAFTNKKRSLHDMIAGTVVIYASK